MTGYRHCFEYPNNPLIQYTSKSTYHEIFPLRLNTVLPVWTGILGKHFQLSRTLLSLFLPRCQLTVNSRRANQNGSTGSALGLFHQMLLLGILSRVMWCMPLSQGQSGDDVGIWKVAHKAEEMLLCILWGPDVHAGPSAYLLAIRKGSSAARHHLEHVNTNEPASWISFQEHQRSTSPRSMNQLMMTPILHWRILKPTALDYMCNI